VCSAHQHQRTLPNAGYTTDVSAEAFGAPAAAAGRAGALDEEAAAVVDAAAAAGGEVVFRLVLRLLLSFDDDSFFLLEDAAAAAAAAAELLVVVVAAVFAGAGVGGVCSSSLSPKSQPSSAPAVVPVLDCSLSLSDDSSLPTTARQRLRRSISSVRITVFLGALRMNGCLRSSFADGRCNRSSIMACGGVHQSETNQCMMHGTDWQHCLHLPLRGPS
jgi:hypothetical protein